MSVPTYLPYVILIGNGLTLFAIFYGLNRALAEASWQRTERLRALTISAVILLGWLAIALGLSGAGFYHVVQSGIPTIQYGLFLPILIGVFLIFRSELAGRILDAVPQPWIVGVQFYRAFGVVFLILYAAGQLPALFAWPAGVGDIMVGCRPPWLPTPMRERRANPRPRQGVERVRHSRPHRRGDTGLPHLTVRDHANCGSSLERTGDDAPHGDDPGLYGAALDPAAHHLAREIAPRAASRGRLQENGPRGSLITAQENTGPRILNGVRGRVVLG
jgi:hypothetical protein